MDATALRTLDCRAEFIGTDGIKLTVARRGWAAGTAIDDITSGAAPAERMLATQDGRHAQLDQWHEGECSEEVFYERYGLTAAGEFARLGHGWIDAETRRLIQAG